MILSASRRTDIPCFYSDWFYNRIKEGFVYVRNPVNTHQISRISLSPEVVDCIVFWTKNPENMLARLEELAVYRYYFQFTLTGYGPDIEPNVPHKKERMIPVFRELSQQTGAGRVIWRYDPILFTDRYTPEYHLQAFTQIAQALRGYTNRCVISFVDSYAGSRNRMSEIVLSEKSIADLSVFLAEMAAVAADNGMTLSTCAEKADLEQFGIRHNSCIDREIIEQILGCRIKISKDRNQRKECGCMESIDIGTYNTCRNGCLYCYANYSDAEVRSNGMRYDPDGPILCGKAGPQDRIRNREVHSCRIDQLSLFD